MLQSSSITHGPTWRRQAQPIVVWLSSTQPQCDPRWTVEWRESSSPQTRVGRLVLRPDVRVADAAHVVRIRLTARWSISYVSRPRVAKNVDYEGSIRRIATFGSVRLVSRGRV